MNLMDRPGRGRGARAPSRPPWLRHCCYTYTARSCLPIWSLESLFELHRDHRVQRTVMARAVHLFLTRLGDSQSSVHTADTSHQSTCPDHDNYRQPLLQTYVITVNAFHVYECWASQRPVYFTPTILSGIRSSTNPWICSRCGSGTIVHSCFVRYNDPEFLRSSVAGGYHGDVASAALSCFETSPGGFSHTGGWNVIGNSAESCCESRILIKLVWFDVVHIRLLRCSRPSWWKAASLKSGFQGQPSIAVSLRWVYR